MEGQPPASTAKPLGIRQTEGHGHGAADMERGADVGAGVAGVKPTDHIGQKILPGKYHGPQILAMVNTIIRRKACGSAKKV